MSHARTSKRRKVSHTTDPSIGDSLDSTYNEMANGSSDTRIADQMHVKHLRHLDHHEVDGDIMQMQTADLLQELDKLRQRRLQAARPILQILREVIQSIPDKPAVSPLVGEQTLWRRSHVAVPFPHPRPDADARYKVSYQQPSRINVVGSFANNVALVRKRHITTIDLALTMPKASFAEKDYLDHRYFHKRAFYLACVAEALTQSTEISVSLRYDLLNDSSLQPVILVVPDGSLGQKFQFRILLTIDQDTFPLKKTLPTSLCIRNTLCRNADNSSLSTSYIYNATVRAECNVESYLKLLQSSINSFKGLSDACVLFSVWLAQRNLGGRFSLGGFGCFEAAVLLSLLLVGGGVDDKPLLSSGLSGLQLFKAVLLLLQNRDLVASPIIIGHKDAQNISLQSTAPVFWDNHRGMNILYKMSVNSYHTLRHHARLSSHAFEQANIDPFRCIFAEKVAEPALIFDDRFTVRFGKDQVQTSGLEGEPPYDFLIKKLSGTLTRALGQRASLVEVKPVLADTSCSISERPTHSAGVLEGGLLLNSEHFNRAVDRGPSAEAKQAASSFRQFWGEKAELRRYRDGSITESVVWYEGDEAFHRQILRYIGKFHGKIDLYFEGPEPTGRSQNPRFAQDSSLRLNKAWQAFEALYSALKDDSRLPLPIRQMSPSHWTPDNTDCGLIRNDVFEVAVQLENSANWPEDLVAIQETKTALLLKIAQSLQTRNKKYTCQLGQDSLQSSTCNHSFLDVSSADENPRLRLRIVHDREADLLKSKIQTSRSIRERQLTSAALALFNRTFVHGPSHMQSVRRLSLRMPVLLPSIMLFRKWCSSHLLSCHLPAELLDLLVIHVFTAHWPYAAPSNIYTALLRTLHFIAHWDWQNNALTVGTNIDMTASQVGESSTRLKAWRKIDPQMRRLAVFVASSDTPDGAIWTQNNPTKYVFLRLAALARTALTQGLASNSQVNLSSIFATGLLDFDFVLHLKEGQSSQNSQGRLVRNFKNIEQASSVATAGSSTSPSQGLVQELTSVFSDAVVFFHDFAERPIIAGIWTPDCHTANWKPGSEISSEPSSATVAQTPYSRANKRAILNDIARLGLNLVHGIEIKGG